MFFLNKNLIPKCKLYKLIFVWKSKPNNMAFQSKLLYNSFSASFFSVDTYSISIYVGVSVCQYRSVTKIHGLTFHFRTFPLFFSPAFSLHSLFFHSNCYVSKRNPFLLLYPLFWKWLFLLHAHRPERSSISCLYNSIIIKIGNQPIYKWLLVV